jgi:hypothetical protein
MGNGSEDIRGVCRSSLNAVSVVDTTLSSFRIYVKELQVVVEIDGSGAKISSKECSVGGENGSNINAALLAERKSYTSQPFVELNNNGFFLFVVDELLNC